MEFIELAFGEVDKYFHMKLLQAFGEFNKFTK